MRALALCTALATAALPVSAGTLSDEIGAAGIAATERRLAALPAPTDADRFALAGLRFLGAAEAALHLRWSAGIPPNMTGMPFFSLPVAENPDPVPFRPGLIADLFRDVTGRMAGVSAPLAAIPDKSSFGVEIDLGDLWFDIDGSGTRDKGEDAMDVIGPMLLGWQWLERDPAMPVPVIRFDVADAAWLSAYSHFIAGFGSTLLAYDPTVAITEVTSARTQIDALRGAPRGDLMLGMYSEWIDIASVVLRALDQTPDGARMAEARAQFLAMIADNRSFWRRAAAERDNDREWIPNDRQAAALGFTLPPGTGTVWQAVLDDAEAVLGGERLVPYLWLGEDAGLNVGRMFTDPRPIDVAAWVQGLGALPYLEKGTLISPENVSLFAQMVQGQTLLFMVVLN